MSGILCCTAGVFQHFDKLSKTSSSVMVTTLVVSILAKCSVASASRSVIVYTTELYPTIIRTTGFSFQATVGRFGAIVSPFLIHINGYFPGAMYVICGVILVISSVCILFLRETKDMVLQDYIRPDPSDLSTK
ncbi:solute carrier family 22 member 6-A-like [Ruditapes philippinarum]|uniref:solute carrier family 22 member 6-A-like n=1 Tax=Ruditapes philippinarum TaxID=129788 RepID=UPI00295BCC8B|nr:solute carrier family 22 member 6-A-like [Ruditapes philippinarum]